ncbi:MAG: CoB--CoM heterodisulfide reductase subunit C [Promethearchaeota archaeon]
MEKIQRSQILHISDTITEKLVKDEALAFVRACFQCGTCTGGCPSGRRTAIRTRQIIRKAVLGLEEVLSSDDIWLCSTCYTCFERCPRHIPVTDIIIMLRNLASQRGYMKPPHKAVTHILADTGHGVPLGTKKGGEPNNWSNLRAVYGLPDIPPTTHSHPEAVHDIQELMRSTEFDKLVGWEPKEVEKSKENPEKKSMEKPGEKKAEKTVEKSEKKATKKQPTEKLAKQTEKKNKGKTASKKKSKVKKTSIRKTSRRSRKKSAE